MPCLGFLPVRHIFRENNQKQAGGQRETQVFVGSTDEQHPVMLAACAGAEAKTNFTHKIGVIVSSISSYLDNIPKVMSQSPSQRKFELFCLLMRSASRGRDCRL